MKYLFVSIFLLSTGYSFSQKPPLKINELNLYGKWPFVRTPYICSNGNYVGYTVDNQPAGMHTLVIRDIKGDWEKRYVDASMIGWSADSKHALFQQGDTLNFLALGAGVIDAVLHVKSVKFPKSGEGEWIAYQIKTGEPNGKLILRDMMSLQVREFQSVSDYMFEEHGKRLLIKTQVDRGNGLAVSLQWISLPELKVADIWSSEIGSADMIGRYSFDNAGEQLVFIESKKGSASDANTLWYYKIGMEKAVIKANGHTRGIAEGLIVGGYPIFSNNNQWVFFSLEKPKDTLKPTGDAVMVNVWNYKDVDIPPEQQRLLKSIKGFTAVVNINSEKVLCLEHDNELVCTIGRSVAGDFVVVKDNFFGDHPASYWRDSSLQPTYYLISLKDGTRTILRNKFNYSLFFTFSPKGKYLIFFDPHESAYFSYEMATGVCRNISKAMRVHVNKEDLNNITPSAVAPMPGWIENDEAVLLYDNYDLWKVDPSGRSAPTNITKGYGRANKIKLRVLNGAEGKVFKTNDSLLLVGFNCTNKYNGFYKKDLSHSGYPELLTMGPYTFFHDDSQLPGDSWEISGGISPQKAMKRNAWIVLRQSVNEAPNFYFTGDFKNYIALSNIEPQRDVNWMSADLITWRTFDGTLAQGILYKPEDFDRSKKYPLIFNYYENYSYRLYEFPYPKLTADNIEIAWFVSNGYLVFTPDIKFKIGTVTGKPVGAWTYNSVISAAQFLSKLPYIDRTKMGVQGHSFGGMETNYLISHSSIFAAAAEAAGASDPVSGYLTLLPFLSPVEHFSGQDVIERGHDLINATLWQRPELYLDNSTVLNADKVTTPLLIMHNEEDNSIQWRQGIELYMALRRLGKKVWMLQYDKEGHVLYLERDARDYTIRLTQFFDHYLKDMPAPVWMTQGIPAKLKGIKTGYELDQYGMKP